MAMQETIEGVLMFFAAAIIMITVFMVWNTINNDAGIDSNIFQQSSVGSTMKSNTNGFFVKSDSLLMVGYIALHLGLIVLAFLFRTHPIMYIVFIFVILILVWIAPMLSNQYETLMDTPSYSNVENSFSKTTLIFNNLPKLEVIFAFVSAIIMFGLARYEGLL